MLKWWERCGREKVNMEINQYKANISERMCGRKGQLQIQPGNGAPQHPITEKPVRGSDKKWGTFPPNLAGEERTFWRGRSNSGERCAYQGPDLS